MFGKQRRSHDAQDAIGLGDRVTDKITSFTGVVTGQVSYITGCDQVLVAPTIDKDGDLRNSHWFDVLRLVLVEKHAITLQSVAAVDLAMPARSGSDEPAPNK